VGFCAKIGREAASEASSPDNTPTADCREALAEQHKTTNKALTNKTMSGLFFTGLRYYII